MRTRQRPLIRFIHSLRTYAGRRELGDLRRICTMLANDRQFRAFHEGHTETLPEFYHWELRGRLGPYARLLDRAERTPVFAPPTAVPVTARAAS